MKPENALTVVSRFHGIEPGVSHCPVEGMYVKESWKSLFIMPILTALECS